MNCLEESYEEKRIKQRLLYKKRRPYLLITTTSIITGILILITIITIITDTVSLSTIFVDILMILWHTILLFRIHSIEKDLDIAKVDSSQIIDRKDTSDEDIDWI